MRDAVGTTAVPVFSVAHGSQAAGETWSFGRGIGAERGLSFPYDADNTYPV